MVGTGAVNHQPACHRAVECSLQRRIDEPPCRLFCASPSALCKTRDPLSTLPGVGLSSCFCANAGGTRYSLCHSSHYLPLPISPSRPVNTAVHIDGIAASGNQNTETRQARLPEADYISWASVIVAFPYRPAPRAGRVSCGRTSIANL
jgi:hypothetical protein